MAKTKGTVTEYRNYYLPLHFPVLLLTGEHWKISDVPSGRQHFHNCLEIGICHSDSGTIEIFGEPISFREGDVTVIPQNVPHTTYSAPGQESRWSYIYIDPKELFKGLLPSTWQNPDLSVYSLKDFQPIFHKDDYPTLHQLVIGTVKELEEQRLNYQLSAKGLLLSLYIEIYRAQMCEKQGGMSQNSDSASGISLQELESPLSIAPALDYIEDNYAQQFTINDLADLCHWSPTHFRRVFHDIMGTSPLDFVNNTRITKACMMLRTTEDSILNISENVGFRSVSSFNRYFIKKMEMSPRDYRKQMQQSDMRVEGQQIKEYSGWMYPE